MLNYSPEWVIASPYIYKTFNPQAIHSVLNHLQPELARIWYIGQQEKATTPIPYFEGEYAVSDITDEDIQHWQTLARSMTFKLPEEDKLFSSEVVKVVPGTILEPKLLKDEPGLEVWLTHRKNNRKGLGRVDVLLNSELFAKNLEYHVLAQLFVQVLKSQHRTLTQRAKQSGSGLKFDYNGNDFIISLNKSTANHMLIMQKVMAQLTDWNVSLAEFSQARDSLLQRFNRKRKSPPIAQANGLLHSQIRQNGWSQEGEVAAIEAVSLDDLRVFKRQLFKHNKLRVFAYGNYDEVMVETIVAGVEQALPANRKKQFNRFERASITPAPGMHKSYKMSTAGHTDNALMEYLVLPKTGDAGVAHMKMLSVLMKDRFFTQLRTNEQLGYTVGVSVKQVNDYPGLMLYVQSNNTELPLIKDRIDRFRREFMVELEQISDEAIEQIIQAEQDLLSKERRRYLFMDFYRGRLDFDSRNKLNEAFDDVNKDSLINLYKSIVLNQNGASILVQVKGRGFSSTPFSSNVH